MSGWHRTLGVASHLTVALWLGGYLAWSVRTAAEPGPAPAATARIQPRPEPAAAPAAAPAEPPAEVARAEPAAPPEPEPEPEPEPDVAPAAPEPTRVGRVERARGDALLDGAGRFPALSASYEDFPSFVDYARAMEALGARFVVVRHRKILGTIDPASGVMRETPLERAYSPRARDYSGEPELASIALAIRGRFGRGAEVMMLVPRALDAGLFGGIAGALSGRGERHGEYREIQGRYVRGPDGGVRLRLDAGIRTDGRRVPFELLFDLGDIVRGPRSAA